MSAPGSGTAHGFLHLNTPTAVSYTHSDKLITTDDVQVTSRLSTITTDATIKWWRHACDGYRQNDGKPLTGKEAFLQQAGSSSGRGGDVAADDDVVELKAAPALKIQSHHLLQGHVEFEYKLLDAVAGVLQPRLYREEEDACGAAAGDADTLALEAEVGHRFILKGDLSPSDIDPYEKLLRLFKKGSAAPPAATTGTGETPATTTAAPSTTEVSKPQHGSRTIIRVSKKRKIEVIEDAVGTAANGGTTGGGSLVTGSAPGGGGGTGDDQDAYDDDYYDDDFDDEDDLHAQPTTGGGGAGDHVDDEEDEIDVDALLSLLQDQGAS